MTVVQEAEPPVSIDRQKELFSPVYAAELLQALSTYPNCEAIVDFDDYERGLQELVSRSENGFVMQYEAIPTIHVKGSKRFEWLGNFTDQGRGLRAMGFATNAGVVGAVGERDDKEIHIYSEIDGRVEFRSIDLNNLPKVTDAKDWVNYEIATLTQLKEFLGEEAYKQLKGANFYIVSDPVQGGTGISSSAAVEGLFAHGFLGLNDIHIPNRELVRRMQVGENKISSCGYLDQVLSNFEVESGEGAVIRFRDPGDKIPYQAEKVYMDIEKHGAQVTLVYLENAKRNLSETDYPTKARLIQEGTEELAVLTGKSVYDLTLEDVYLHYQQLTEVDEEMARAVLHVYSDDKRVEESAELFKRLRHVAPGSQESMSILRRQGQLFRESAESSVNNYGVSTGVVIQGRMLPFGPILRAIEAAGAFGERNEGGGGIPSCGALVLKKDMKKFRKQLSSLINRNIRQWIEEQGLSLELYQDMEFSVASLLLGKPSRVVAKAA